MMDRDPAIKTPADLRRHIHAAQVFYDLTFRHDDYDAASLILLDEDVSLVSLCTLLAAALNVAEDDGFDPADAFALLQQFEWNEVT